MVATKSKSKGTPKSKTSATRYYQAKMASRQAEGLKPKGPAKAAEEKAKKDIREAYEAEKEMFRQAAERMAQAEKEQQEEWFRATRPDREAPKAKSEGSKSQRKATTAQKQARGTKQQQKRKETPKPTAKPKKATNKNRAAQKKKDEEEEKEAFRESRQSRAAKSSKEKRAEKFEERRRKQEVEVMDEDSDGDLEVTDVEDPVAVQLASVGIDYSKLTLDELKRIAPLSTLLDKMSPFQIKEALSLSTSFSPDGRSIIRTNVVKPREIPRNTHRFVLDDKGNRIYIG